MWRPGDTDVLTLNLWTTALEPSVGGPELSVSPGMIKSRDPLGGDPRDALPTSDALPAGGRPVLLWLHGGANTFGSSAQPEYDGTALADMGLVVVTCNFRIGFEGFGHVPGAPHNRALLDVEAVLRWIRHRVHEFGGDPGNVTVAGQSAGAQLVACLLQHPKGLFHKAIAHSMPGRYFDEETAKAIAARIDASTPESAVRTGDAITEDVLAEPLYQPVVETKPHEGRLDRTIPLLACHTSEEDEALFREPTRRLAENHGNAHQATFPGGHGADLPSMFADSDVSRAWVKFARTGNPGWVPSEVCRLNGSTSAP